MRIDGQLALADIPSNASLNQVLKTGGEKGQISTDEVKRREIDPMPELKDVRKAVNYSNDVMKLANYHLEFQVQEDSSRYQVKVVDNDSGDIIREIPPDYMMKIAEQLRGKIQAEAGLLIDRIA